MSDALSPWIRISAALLCLTLGPSCTRRFDPQAAPSIRTANSQLDQAYRRAQALFESGDLAQAKEAFAQIAARNPPPPLASVVDLYQARIALERREHSRAQELLEPHLHNATDTALQRSISYYCALAYVGTGRMARGRDILSRQLDTLVGHARISSLLALAHAERSLRDIVPAASHYDQAYALSGRAAERQLARAALTRLIWHELSGDQLQQLESRIPRDGLAFALCSARRINDARQASKADQADALTQRALPRLRRHGVSLARAERAGPSRIIGLLLPHQGRWRPAGDLALAGAVAAAGVFNHKGAPPLELVLRDSSIDAAGQAERLIAETGVRAIFGVFDPQSIRAVAAVAESHGIPFLTIGSAKVPGRLARYTFRLAPENAARARRLASTAIRRGKHRAAIMAPSTRFGQQLGKAFSDAFAAAGGHIVGTIDYPASTTSFTPQAKRLARLSFDTLFVPDTIRRLALIAPALAQAGLWSASDSSRNTQGRREVLLLATADGLRAASLRSAGRYLEGALVAPGYFPDKAAKGPPGGILRTDESRKPGVSTLVEAFAFDGIHALRQACDRSTGGQPLALDDALRRGSAVGLTGPLGFGTEGQRTAPPLLYRVNGHTLTQLP